MVREVNWEKGKKASSSLGALVTSLSPSHPRGGRWGPCAQPWEWSSDYGPPTTWCPRSARAGSLALSPSPVPSGQLIICGTWSLIVVVTGLCELEAVWQCWPPSLPPLPAGSREKRAGIVLGINEPLSKQTPERGAAGLQLPLWAPAEGRRPRKERFKPGWGVSSLTILCAKSEPQTDWPSTPPSKWFPISEMPDLCPWAWLGEENYPEASWLYMKGNAIVKLFCQRG